jgi:hypothetical protein
MYGCEKEREYNPASVSPPRLFVIGQADPLLGVSVKVTKAVSVGQSANFDTLFVSNATVQLIKPDGGNYNLANQGNGLFTLDTSIHKVSPGDSCSIRVTNVPYFPDCFSSNIIVPQATKSVYSIGVWKTGNMNGNLPEGEGVIKFSDELSNHDIYMTRLYGQFNNDAPGLLGCYVSLNPLCEANRYPGLPDVAFKDECIAGENTIEIQFYGVLNGVPNIGPWVAADKVIIYFGTVSENYYEFIYALNQPEDIEKGLADPKPSYSNMKGGLGIFYATNLTKKVIEL